MALRDVGPSRAADRDLLAQLLDGIALGLYVWELEDPADPAGMRLLFANPASELATGLAVEAVVGRTMRESFPEDALSSVIAEVALGGESRYLGDVVYSDPRVSQRTFSVRVFPLSERRAVVAFNDVSRERASGVGVHAALESMSDAFWMVDGEFRIVYVNSEYERQVAMPRGELLGRLVLDVFPENAEAPIWLAAEQAFRDQVSCEREEYYAAWDRWFSVRYYPSPAGVAMYFHDITQRKALEAEQELLSHIAVGVRIGLYVWELEDPADPGGMRLVYANPASELATGLPVESVVGRTMREVVPRTTAARQALLAEVALGGEPRDLGDVVYGDERISERVFSTNIFPLPQRRVGVTFLDVTETRSAERRLWTTVESMSEGFYAMDREWRHTYMNPAAARTARDASAIRLDLPLADRPPLWEYAPDLVDTPIYEDFQRAAREGVSVEAEYLVPGYAAGERWMAVRIDPSPEGFSVFTRDITERKKLEAHLLQSEKLEIVGQLASGVAHDFNNLLTVIRGYTGLALSQLGDPEFLALSLHEIDAASASASALTAQLLAFSRTQARRTAVMSVNGIVTAAFDLAGPLLGANVEVEMDLQTDVGCTVVDPNQLEQVLVNLAVNARDAMPRGGHLAVATRLVTLERDTVAGLDAGAYAAIVVADTGSGMDAGTLAKIFEPFFTTKPVGKGTGLGLSTSQAAVVAAGGQIAVASTPGEGSTFTIYLPHTDDQAADVATRLEAIPGGGGERILAVDDDANIRRLVTVALVGRRYEVMEAADAEAALQLLGESHFDLLITDTLMPGIDGIALARRAVELQPQLPILHISGYTAGSMSQLDVPGTETDFLQKPFTADELARRVRDLIDRASG